MVHTSSEHIAYETTGRFSALVTDYLQGHPALKDFYVHTPGEIGIRDAIKTKTENPVDRSLLVNRLKAQYSGMSTDSSVMNNIESLLSVDTFTICTAHQPNILTGHLYFIYKIIHVIKLAYELNETIEGKRFVPVYYMGSEDADLQELGSVVIDGVHHRWNTSQKGAVGRMLVDKPFMDLLDSVAGTLSVRPYGPEAVECMRRCYTEGISIEQATFHLVNRLFQTYGLIVLLPDHTELKSCFRQVMKAELLEQPSFPILQETIRNFPDRYPVQVKGRPINLFYLKDNIRERIEFNGSHFVVSNTSLQFSRDEIVEELEAYPDRFSPNVILRPLYQEILLPNVAFIGGGGELAYWLELKNIFVHHQVPYPVLLLRNSFMCIDARAVSWADSLGLKPEDLFKPLPELTSLIIKKNNETSEDLSSEIQALKLIFEQLKDRSGKVDDTLVPHVSAIEKQLLNKIDQLSGKIWRAEKRKYQVWVNKTEKMHAQLFPEGNLQERVDNFFSYYASYGNDFITQLYRHSNAFSSDFCIVKFD